MNRLCSHDTVHPNEQDKRKIHNYRQNHLHTATREASNKKTYVPGEEDDIDEGGGGRGIGGGGGGGRRRRRRNGGIEKDPLSSQTRLNMRTSLRWRDDFYRRQLRGCYCSMRSSRRILLHLLLLILNPTSRMDLTPAPAAAAALHPSLCLCGQSEMLTPRSLTTSPASLDFQKHTLIVARATPSNCTGPHSET